MIPCLIYSRMSKNKFLLLMLSKLEYSYITTNHNTTNYFIIPAIISVANGRNKCYYFKCVNYDY